MKRDILFRGKKKQGEWVYGLLGCNYFRPNEKYYYIHNCETDDTEHEVILETVGQFTGLTDKNGKKIFEGDIVQGTIVSAWNKALIRCEVVYNKDGFIAVEKTRNQDWTHKLKFAKDIEVIGNIHDQDIGEKKNG